MHLVAVSAVVAVVSLSLLYQPALATSPSPDSTSLHCLGRVGIVGNAKAGTVYGAIFLRSSLATAVSPVDPVTGFFTALFPAGTTAATVQAVAPASWLVEPEQAPLEFTKCNLGALPTVLGGDDVTAAADPFAARFTVRGLKTVTARVRVAAPCDDGGQPMAGVNVRLGATVNATTDATGRATLVGVPFGTHQVTVSRTETANVTLKFPKHLMPVSTEDDVVPVRFMFRAPPFFVASPTPSPSTQANADHGEEVFDLDAVSEGSSVVVPFTRADELVKKGKVPRVIMELTNDENGRVSRAVLLRNHVAIFPPQPCGHYSMKAAGEIETVPGQSTVLVFGGQPSFSEVIFEPLHSEEL